MPTMMNTRNGAGVKKNKKKKKKKKKSSPDLAQQMASVKAALDKTPLDVKNLSNQCLLLSKVLDSLVELNRKPIYRDELLPLVQQVCKYKETAEVRPALMVLLLSIKSAFRADWLPTPEVSGKDEVFSTLNLLFDSFTTSQEDVAQNSLQCGGSAVTEPLEAMNFLVSISDRFYPRLQLKAVFVAVPAKVGYEVLMCDFHVPHMNIQDRVRLYVTKTDSTETSTCLITPPQVNILVNGRQVEKRVITDYLDAGPQMPSDVNHLVKVGANVLQVIGEFSGPYIIAVASSTTIQHSANNTHLEDHIPPTNTEVNYPPTTLDDEVVEGASRLSLRCPISHQRLVTPVKATTCRHLQCFEYDSFLEINEKRPSWRCPCCNRFTSLPDLRIDRKMEKILRETDERIHEVIISQDGSWAAIPSDETHTFDAAPVEGCEEVIDLSYEVGDDRAVHETKPGEQTLLEIQQGNYIPDITATGPPNLQGFAGPSWAAASTRNDVNLSNSHGNNNSRTGFHLNSLHVGGHRTHTQLQPSTQTQHQLATQIQGLQLSEQSASFSQIPVSHETPTLQEQNSWRPGAIRMRGSIANPSAIAPANALRQRCAFNTGPNYSESDAHAE